MRFGQFKVGGRLGKPQVSVEHPAREIVAIGSECGVDGRDERFADRNRGLGCGRNPRLFLLLGQQRSGIHVGSPPSFGVRVGVRVGVREFGVGVGVGGRIAIGFFFFQRDIRFRE
jgi:hypothetical protein